MSRSMPKAAEFSISSSDTTSAPRLLIAATILSCWRFRFSALAAPRGPLLVHELTVTLTPARSRKYVQVPAPDAA